MVQCHKEGALVYFRIISVISWKHHLPTEEVGSSWLMRNFLSHFRDVAEFGLVTFYTHSLLAINKI